MSGSGCRTAGTKTIVALPLTEVPGRQGIVNCALYGEAHSAIGQARCDRRFGFAMIRTSEQWRWVFVLQGVSDRYRRSARPAPPVINTRSEAVRDQQTTDPP